MKRYSIFPIQDQEVWDAYENIHRQIWFAQDVDMSDDVWEALDPSQQRALKILLFFFVNSDKIVADNLTENLRNAEFSSMEAQFFYDYQVFNENVHAHTYSLLIERYIKDPQEKEDAYNAIHNIPVVSQKLKWADKWITQGTDVEKLVAFAVVEGILFSSTFAFIYWLKHLKLPLNGLYFANDEIASDENSHYQFAVFMYNNRISDKLPKRRVKELIMEGYKVEEQYVHDYFGDGVKGMNKDAMLQYIKFVTDTVLHDFGLEKEFNVGNPLTFMATLITKGHTNFFEKKVDDYTRLSSSDIDLDDMAGFNW